ncbi:MAG: hypothetical protein R2697_23005 [Ilumatobacteraceae bacterium]
MPNIAGQGEAGQGGERRVGRPADPRLEHASAPDRHVRIAAEIVHAHGLEVAPTRPALMLMTDAAHSARASAAAFADTIDSSRQTGVRRRAARVAWSTMSSPAGLLDQQQVEAVQFGEGVDIGEGIGGVRVDLQRNGTEGIPQAAVSATSRPGLILILMRT